MGDRSYSLETIQQLAQKMAAYNPAWLEEPLPPDDHDSYIEFHKTIPFPLASGEHEPDEERFLDLITSRAVDWVQMDVCCQGGFEMGRRVFEAAEKQGLRFAFHSWGTVLEVLAAAHLGVCYSPDVVEWLEYPCYSNQGRAGMYPFAAADEILAEPLPMENGDLIVPKEPGLGVPIDESVIERYPFQPGPWSIFKIDSPPETLAVSGDHSVKWVDAEGR
jgi:L-alanine-DL-glutamate epimerase-like enolase superfamily enzyme